MAKNQKRESTFLTQEEIGAMLRVPNRRTLQGRRDYALLLIMFGSVLRSAEVCSLNVGDIQSYRNQPVLVVSGKGGRIRKVPCHPEAIGAVRAYWNGEGRNGDDPTEPIFQTLGRHGPHKVGRLTHKAIRCLVERTAKAALIKKRVTPHTLRHTFAVSVLDARVDLRTLMELLGHRHISTTERYTHSSDEKKLAAVNALTFET